MEILLVPVAALGCRKEDTLSLACDAVVVRVLSLRSCSRVAPVAVYHVHVHVVVAYSCSTGAARPWKHRYPVFHCYRVLAQRFVAFLASWHEFQRLTLDLVLV